MPLKSFGAGVWGTTGVSQVPAHAPLPLLCWENSWVSAAGRMDLPSLPQAGPEAHWGCPHGFLKTSSHQYYNCPAL